MKYRLKKDTPYHKAGEEFREDEMFLIPIGRISSGYDTSEIKNFDEWFEEVEEPTWTDKDMIDFAWFCFSEKANYNDTPHALEIFKQLRK